MRALALIVLSLSVPAVAATAVACATSRFDQHLEAHRWAQAAHAFEAEPDLQQRADALYRAALLYASPVRDTYRPSHARDLFSRLLQLSPDRTRQEAARGMIGLLDVVAGDSVREESLRTELDSLRAESGRLQEENASLRTRSETQEELNKVLRSYTVRLEADLRDREQRLRALGDELDRLKQIDLEAPGRTNGSTTIVPPKPRTPSRPSGAGAGGHAP